MVSLKDEGRKLTAVFEASWEPTRPRWQVRFELLHAYRVTDEISLTDLWLHLDRSKQRCGGSFTVEASPWIAELSWLGPQPRHWVITTMDDVLEVATAVEPVWETVPPAPRVARRASALQPLPSRSNT